MFVLLQIARVTQLYPISQTHLYIIIETVVIFMLHFNILAGHHNNSNYLKKYNI